jgi:hypothetical protein
LQPPWRCGLLGIIIATKVLPIDEHIWNCSLPRDLEQSRLDLVAITHSVQFQHFDLVACADRTWKRLLCFGAVWAIGLGKDNDLGCRGLVNIVLEDMHANYNGNTVSKQQLASFSAISLSMKVLMLPSEAGVPLLFPIVDIVFWKGLCAIDVFVRKPTKANTRSRPPFIDGDSFNEVLLARAAMLIVCVARNCS